jgi:intracellular septation protein
MGGLISGGNLIADAVADHAGDRRPPSSPPCCRSYLRAARRKVDGMLWLSLGVIVVFGGATIYFHDENFIKWKPTILYWAFAPALFVSAGVPSART